MRLGVISNPYAYRNLHNTNEVRSLVHNRGAVVHFEAKNADEISGIMPELARAETDVLVINGGDGTVGAALTAVLSNGVFEKPPRFAVIPAGRTNSIAHDVGQTGNPQRVLASLIEAANADRPVRSVRRRVLRIDPAEGREPLYGMVLGGAAFYDWIRLARQTVERFGFTQSSIAWLTAAYLCFKYLSGSTAHKTLFGATDIGLSLDGKAEPACNYVLLLATTLRKLAAGLSPFWGNKGGTLRYTLINHRPDRPLSGAILTLFGRPRPWMAQAGFRSGSAERIKLSLSRPLVLDGEFIQPPSSGAIEVSAQDVVSFIRC